MKLLNNETSALVTQILNESNGNKTRNIVFAAPQGTDGKLPRNAYKVFLAGTIDDGNSIDWQHQVCDRIKETTENKKPIVIFNPRRDDWPEDGRQRAITNQINWELDHMEQADLIIMNIVADSKSPISLMELGIHCHDEKLVVFCPDTFYHYDNVRIVCERFNIPLHNTNNVTRIVTEIINLANK